MTAHRPHPRRSSSAATRSWDTFSPARPYQPFWVGLALLFLLPGLVLTFLRLLPPSEDAPALVASFIPYAVLTYLVSLSGFTIALVRARRRTALAVMTAATAMLLTCHTWWLAPFFLSNDRPATTTSFALMSLNLQNGDADPAAVAQQAQAADVVVLVEATGDSIGRLARHGWHKRFPHSAGRLQPAAGGTMIFSRFPLTEQTSLSQFQFQQWIATVVVPQLGPVRVLAAHPCNPYCGSGRWSREHQQIRDVVATNLGRPLVVAGDLNAVDDHRPILALRRDGLSSATDLVGAGWLPTYPANRTLPPLLPIDHILLNRFLTATSIDRFAVPGTDHLGLLAQIAGTRA